MKTKKQQELIETYLSQLENKDQTIYRELIVYLSELGYNPKKEGLRISFKHDLHSKQAVSYTHLCCGFPLVKITLRDLRIL